jgi:hypothetical protein
LNQAEKTEGQRDNSPHNLGSFQFFLLSKEANLYPLTSTFQALALGSRAQTSSAPTSIFQALNLGSPEFPFLSEFFTKIVWKERFSLSGMEFSETFDYDNTYY